MRRWMRCAISFEAESVSSRVVPFATASTASRPDLVIPAWAASIATFFPRPTVPKDT